jgi:DMSO reductase anchor subunit
VPATRRILRRAGRRGAALLVFAFIDVVLGWSLVDPSTRKQTAALPMYAAIQKAAPLPVWGALWLAVAAVCVVFAFRRRDAPAYACAVGIKLVWAVGFLASWAFYGAARSWLAAATWGVVAALVYLISGWPEPDR